MIVEEESGGYATNGRFKNVSQTEQLERPNREEYGGRNTTLSEWSINKAFF